MTRGASAARSAKIAGYVLAGGASTRFGRDKALVELGGRPMLLRMCGLLSEVANEVKVVSPARRYARYGVCVVEDRWPGEGALSGIVTALLDAEASNAASAWNLIVSCDMPFLTKEWIMYLAERATKSEADVILPLSSSGLEPLCACWRTSTATSVQAEFESGARKVTDAMKGLKTEVLDEADWKRFDNAGRLFWNMNTAADFEEVRRAWEAERQ